MNNQDYTSPRLSLDERERLLEEKEKQFDEKVARTLAYLSSALQELSSEFSQTHGVSKTPLVMDENRPKQETMSPRYHEVVLKASISPEEQSYIEGFQTLSSFYRGDRVCQRDVPVSRSILLALQQGEDDVKRDINDGVCSFSTETSAYTEGGQRFLKVLKETVGDISNIEVRLESTLNQGLVKVAFKELEQSQNMQLEQGQLSRS